MIRTSEPGWWDIAGGKLTTYRLMAEQMVDRLAAHLDRETPPCRTAEEPLLMPTEAVERSGIAPPPVEQPAVEHYCRREWAVHLADVMIRRTSWHHYWPAAPQMAEQVAGWMADSLGWTAEQTAAELAAYQALCRADRACCGNGPAETK